MMRKYIFAALPVILLLFACAPKHSYDGYMGDGMKKFEKGDYEGAIESYMKALELEPESAVTYNMLGMAYRYRYNKTRARKYFDKQVEAFKKAISLDPRYSVAMINLASTYYHNSQKDVAMPLFKSALKLNPDHPEKDAIEKMIEDFEKNEAK
jgi:superkiller protein 3